MENNEISEIVRVFGTKPNSVEHKEMLYYRKVYFFGPSDKNVKGRATRKDYDTISFLKQPSQNSLPVIRRDDGEGFYLYRRQDHLMYRYEIKRELGCDGFGRVCEAYDHKNKRIVAIKNFNKIFMREFDIMQEIHLMARFKTLDMGNFFPSLFDMFRFRGHTFMVMEKLGVDLVDFAELHKRNGIRNEMLQRIALSLFQCVDILHADLKVIHGNIRNENILMKDDGIRPSFRLADFGMACHINTLDAYRHDYIDRSTAPEIILEAELTPALDIWSIGCTLYELFAGETLFPGEDEHELIALMIRVLGAPPLDFLADCRLAKNFFAEDGQPLHCTRYNANKSETTQTASTSSAEESKPLPQRVNMDDLLDSISLSHKDKVDCRFVDLVRSCLMWDPAQRITPSEALQLPYIMEEIGRQKMEARSSTTLL